MGRRVGRRQQHLMSTTGEFDRDGRGQRRLADPALAHEHQQSLAGPRDFVDHRGQIRKIRSRFGVRDRLARFIGRARGEPAQCLDADEILRVQRKGFARQAGEFRVHRLQCRPLPRRQGLGEGVVIAGVRQQAVDGQMLVADPDRGQFARRPGRLGQGRTVRARDEDQPRDGLVGEPLDGGGIARALLLEPGQRTEAGRIALALLQEARPGARQAEQPDGMAGGRRVEGGFNRSLQHRETGGVVWDDQRVGQRSKRGDHRCTRQAVRMAFGGRQ